jgi:hypothetical protein
VNVILGVVELQKQHLRHDQVGAVVIDNTLHEDYAVFEQPAVYIEDTLFAASAFNDVWDHGHLSFSSVRKPQIEPRWLVVGG